MILIFLAGKCQDSLLINSKSQHELKNESGGLSTV